MTEQEMYNSLNKIWENITTDGDRTIYSKMLVLLDNMHYLLHNDLQIDYPIEMYGECVKNRPTPFDF